MSDPILINDYTPIPEIFCEEKSKEPFVNCKFCEKELIKSDLPYMIEKAYGKNLSTGKREIIFEYACCVDCIESIRQTLSAESVTAIQGYFAEHSRLEKRNEELVKHQLFDVDVWLQQCIIKNKAMDEVDEFQIYAVCQGSDLLFHQAPYMICGEAMDEIAGLLSEKTQEALDDLWDNVLDLPPEVEDLFKTRKPVFL
jgi:hypothetical protein